MGDELPIGRRVAYWRGRRRMSQQVFADRLGKSKSWVDKVERGARSLDKVSTIAEIAAVLRVDQSVLLGHDVRPVADSERAGSVERIRAALAAYDIAVGRRVPDRDVPAAAQVARGVAYAWTTYQHARYPQLTDLLPELISGAQRGHARELASGRVPLVEAYRIGAALLTKLGETELAWLAADRAMTLATGDAVLVASAAVQLGEVLRATGRARSAVSTVRTAAYRIAPVQARWRQPATATSAPPPTCSTRPPTWPTGWATVMTTIAPPSGPPPSPQHGQWRHWSWATRVRRWPGIRGRSDATVGGGYPSSIAPPT